MRFPVIHKLQLYIRFPLYVTAVPPLSNALYKGHQNFPNKGHFAIKITSLKDAKMQIISAARTHYYQINAGCS